MTTVVDIGWRKRKKINADKCIRCLMGISGGEKALNESSACPVSKCAMARVGLKNYESASAAEVNQPAPKLRIVGGIGSTTE